MGNAACPCKARYGGGYLPPDVRAPASGAFFWRVTHASGRTGRMARTVWPPRQGKN